MALQEKRLTVYSQVLFLLTICGLITTCNDIIFCTCRVNWDWNCIDHYWCLLRTTMELMMGRQKQKTQKHTRDKSRWMQSDTFVLQQTPHTNVCNPAVRLKSLTFHHWCYSELAAELFASVMMEKKTSHSPPFFFPFCLRLALPTPSLHMTSTPSIFQVPSVHRPIVLLLVIGHWYKMRFVGPIKETQEYFRT